MMMMMLSRSQRRCVHFGMILALMSQLSVCNGIVTDVNICGQSPTIGAAVVAGVNASYPGLDGAFASAVRLKDYATACSELAKYYIASDSQSWLRWSPPTNWPGPNSTTKAGGKSDYILQDIYDLAGVATTAKIGRNADGGLNWYDHGPKDDPEFMNCLNRHAQMLILMQAWQKTGNPVYINYFDHMIADWVTHLPCRGGVNRSKWDSPGVYNESCATGTMESPWRVLEAGIRMTDVWANAFYGFQRAHEFSTSSRVLMLLGLSEHLAVINGPGRDAHTPNWEMMQWVGLLKTCVSFPELNNAAELIKTSFEQLETLLNDQVYPDGVETEMAFGYDMSTASDFLGTLQLLTHSPLGITPSPSFVNHVEAMFNYGVQVSDQYQFGPRNGDADLSHGGWNNRATSYFKRQDWLYIHTHTENGTKPNGTASVMFPWGGWAVFKSGWQRNDSWSWFDIGKAYGTSGHAHCAKLSLDIRAFGAMLLVDSGRFSYQGDGLSHTLNHEYERTTHAHNTVTIDGKEQQASPALTTSPVNSSNWSFQDDFDIARGSWSRYNELVGEATHKRVVYFKKEAMGFYVVIDQIITTQTRTAQANWHIHPNASVSMSANGVATVTGVETSDTSKKSSVNCDIIPAQMGTATLSTPPTVVRGVTQNATQVWQGWYSQTYDGAWPASVVVHDFDIPKGGGVFGWLIVVSSTHEKRDPSASIKFVSVNTTTATVSVNVRGVSTLLHIPLEGDVSHLQHDSTEAPLV